MQGIRLVVHGDSASGWIDTALGMLRFVLVLMVGVLVVLSVAANLINDNYAFTKLVCVHVLIVALMVVLFKYERRGSHPVRNALAIGYATYIMSSCVFIPTKTSGWLIDGQMYTSLVGLGIPYGPWSSDIHKINMVYRTEEHRPLVLLTELGNNVFVRSEFDVDLLFVPTTARAAERLLADGDLHDFGQVVRDRARDRVEWMVSADRINVRSRSLEVVILSDLQDFCESRLLGGLEPVRVYGSIGMRDSHVVLGGAPPQLGFRLNGWFVEE